MVTEYSVQKIRNYNIENKIAFVTGGSHGIGRAIALDLAREGCLVIICARSLDNLQSTIKELNDINKLDNMYIIADALSEKDLENSISVIIEKYDKIDILINNVGGGGRWGKEIPHETDIRVWYEVYEKNAMAATKCTMKTLPYMMKNNWGRVVTISSIYGYEGGGRPWFNMAKSAEIALMKSLSLNKLYAGNGITFNCVAPGYIMIKDTGWDKICKENKDKYSEALNELPIGKFLQVEDVANVVTFLCSDLAKGVNGQCIRVDGGQTRSF